MKKARTNINAHVKLPMILENHISITNFAGLHDVTPATAWTWMEKRALDVVTMNIMGINRHFIEKSQHNMSQVKRKGVLINLKDFAQKNGVSYTTAYNLLRSGQLVGVSMPRGSRNSHLVKSYQPKKVREAVSWLSN